MEAETSTRPLDPAAFTGKYLSITSFKRDGTSVATPVWFVAEEGRLLVHTGRDSFKVRRIRRNPAVSVAPCTATGRLRGLPMNARAEVLPEDETARVERLLEAKYRLDMVLLRPIRAIQARLHPGRDRGSVILAITSR